MKKLLCIIVRNNCLETMQSFLRFMSLCRIGERILEKYNDLNEMILNAVGMNKKVANALWKIWSVKSVKDFYFMKEFDLPVPHTSNYFWDKVLRISADNYSPSKEDIFRTKHRTLGINEIMFEYEGFSFSIIDVGGQRSERRKWIHCFDRVNAVIYVTSLIEYDTIEYEERVKFVRFQESLNLFEKLTRDWFQNVPIILFLNKVDLFEEMIRKKPLENYFPK